MSGEREGGMDYKELNTMETGSIATVLVEVNIMLFSTLDGIEI